MSSEDTTPSTTAATPPAAETTIEAPASIFGSKPSTEGSIFGSSAATGETSIFNKVSAFGSSSPAPAASGDDKDDGENTGADNEGANKFEPLVNLPEVKVETMEEEEDVMFKVRARLYVFVKEDIYGGEKRENYWKEKGTGEIKLLKHKTFGKVRVLMRRDKTMKICANHLVSPYVDLQPNAGSDRSWAFTATDFADNELKTDAFALKFGNAENAQNYKAAIEEAKKINAALEESEEATEGEEEAGEPSAEGEDLAGDVEKLKVTEEAEQVVAEKAE